MSKASKDYQKIIKELDACRLHCESMNQDGIGVLQEAMDIIADYEAVIEQNNRMVAHYETADMTIKRQAGIYVCPNCGKRIQIGHSHCHWCGKKVSWDRESYASRDYPHLSSRGGKKR